LRIAIDESFFDRGFMRRMRCDDLRQAFVQLTQPRRRAEALVRAHAAAGDKREARALRLDDAPAGRA